MEIPVAADQLARLNPFAVTYRYDEIEFDSFRLTTDEAAKWLTSLRQWAENTVNAATEE